MITLCCENSETIGPSKIEACTNDNFKVVHHKSRSGIVIDGLASQRKEKMPW